MSYERSITDGPPIRGEITEEDSIRYTKYIKGEINYFECFGEERLDDYEGVNG